MKHTLNIGKCPKDLLYIILINIMFCADHFAVTKHYVVGYLLT